MSRNRFRDPEKTLARYDEQDSQKHRPLAGRIAALYERVSGDRQAKEASIETQDSYLRQYCQHHDIFIYDTYKDDPAKSEVPMAERAEGHRLIEDAKRDCFDLVLVHSICRWSRYPDVYKQAQGTMHKLGIDLDCPSEHLSWDSPGESFASDVRLRSSQLVRDIIDKATSDGKYTWAAKGAALGAAPHYGYLPIPAPEWGKNRKRLVIDEQEAAIIRRIFDLLVRQRLSCRQIAALFNQEGVPLPSASPKWDGFRNHVSARKCQGRWSASRVSQIVRDRLFLGQCLYGGTDQRRPVLRLVPAIIDAETFALAQLRLAENSKRSSRNSKRCYLLSGKLRCATCNAAYTGVTENNGTKAKARGWTPRPIYRCQGYQRKFDGQDTQCPFYRLPAVALEDDLWETLVNYLEHYEDRLTELRDEWRNDSQSRGRAACQRDELFRRQRRLEEEETDALRGKSRLGFDLTREQARQILDTVREEKKQLDIKISELDALLLHLDQRQAHVETAEEYIERYRANIREVLDPKMRQEIVAVFLESALVKPGPSGECLVTYRFYTHEALSEHTSIAKAGSRPRFINWCVEVVRILLYGRQRTKG
jgi:hypothetical protein